MLDKASRPAAGPPRPDPGTTTAGRGPGLLRRLRSRAENPLPAAEEGAGAPPDPQALHTAAGGPTDTAAGGPTDTSRTPVSPTGAETEPATRSGETADQDLGHAERADRTGTTAVSAGTEPPDPPADPDPENTRRAVLARAAATGGGLVITPGWRERAARASASRRPDGDRVPALYRWARRQATELRRRRPPRAGLVEFLDRRPTATELSATAKRHRYLIGGLVFTLLLVAGDATAALVVTEQPPAPGVAYRVAVAYPLRLSAPVPSVRRYLDAIDNGERLRERAVVAAAARATLERAKAEAAAAVAGQAQPWITTAPGAPEGGVVPPGAILPGAGGYVLPAPGTFTSGFGSRWGTFHRGIDIAAPIGTPIYAVAAGTVIDAGPAAGFGLWVRIRHDDGTISVYGHMYDFFVSVGERVPAGMQIARMGNRGDSTGPHLHFEIIMDGRHVDPQRWLALHGLSYG